jgi:hypothetical protein
MGFMAGQATILILGVPLAWATVAALEWKWIGRNDRRRLVWHHFALPGLGAATLLSIASHADPLLVLDLWTLSTAAGLAVGRLGCHATCCCTGRGSAWGTHYPWFPHAYRYLPLPMLESLLCLMLLAGGLVARTAVPLGWTGCAILGIYVAWRRAAQPLRLRRPSRTSAGA